MTCWFANGFDDFLNIMFSFKYKGIFIFKILFQFLNLFPIIKEVLKLFLTIKRRYKLIIHIKIVILKESRKFSTFVMLKHTFSLHSIIYPLSFVFIAISPDKLSKTISYIMLHFSPIEWSIRIGAFTFTVFSISIPMALILTKILFIFGSEKLST